MVKKKANDNYLTGKLQDSSKKGLKKFFFDKPYEYMIFSKKNDSSELACDDFVYVPEGAIGRENDVKSYVQKVGKNGVAKINRSYLKGLLTKKAQMKAARELRDLEGAVRGTGTKSGSGNKILEDIEGDMDLSDFKLD